MIQLLFERLGQEDNDTPWLCQARSPTMPSRMRATANRERLRLYQTKKNLHELVPIFKRSQGVCMSSPVTHVLCHHDPRSILSFVKRLTLVQSISILVETCTGQWPMIHPAVMERSQFVAQEGFIAFLSFPSWINELRSQFSLTTC